MASASTGVQHTPGGGQLEGGRGYLGVECSVEWGSWNHGLHLIFDSFISCNA